MVNKFKFGILAKHLIGSSVSSLQRQGPSLHSPLLQATDFLQSLQGLHLVSQNDKSADTRKVLKRKAPKIYYEFMPCLC